MTLAFCLFMGLKSHFRQRNKNAILVELVCSVYESFCDQNKLELISRISDAEDENLMGRKIYGTFCLFG